MEKKYFSLTEIWLRIVIVFYNIILFKEVILLFSHFILKNHPLIIWDEELNLKLIISVVTKDSITQ